MHEHEAKNRRKTGMDITSALYRQYLSVNDICQQFSVCHRTGQRDLLRVETVTEVLHPESATGPSDKRARQTESEGFLLMPDNTDRLKADIFEPLRTRYRNIFINQDITCPSLILPFSEIYITHNLPRLHIMKKIVITFFVIGFSTTSFAAKYRLKRQGSAMKRPDNQQKWPCY
jgi:hypothetical protein